MKFFVRLLSVLAIIGLLVVPVSLSAAGSAMSAAGGALAQAMADSDDMPCCPDDRRAKSDCDQSCPLAIICSTSAPLALLKADWSSVSLSWTDHVYGEQLSTRLSSLAAEPPARPPKA